MKNIRPTKNSAKWLSLCGALLLFPVTSFAHGDGNDDHGSSLSGSSSSAAFTSVGTSSSQSEGSASSRSGAANSSSHSSNASQQRTNVRISFAPAAGVITNAKGRVEYRRKKGEGESRFEVKVKVPLGSTIPLLPDENSAALLQLTARVIRASQIVTSCVLAFDEIDDDSLNVKYKTEVRAKKNGTIRVKKGECGDEAGSAVTSVPTLRSGDTVQVETFADGIILEKIVP